MTPVNVDGIRRLLNGSPAASSDTELRHCLALLAAGADPEGFPEDIVEDARQFVEALGQTP
jgi:hypothetical protein